MDRRNFKKKVAELIASTAVAKAEKTVGRSWPGGVHEVEIPTELKQNRINEEA